MSSGRPRPQKSVVREAEGAQSLNVEGSRSRNVEVRRNRRYHIEDSAWWLCRELAKLSVVEDTCHEERSTL
jgi:hypothetical protein